MNTKMSRTWWIVAVVMVTGLLGFSARQQREFASVVSLFTAPEANQSAQPQVTPPPIPGALSSPISAIPALPSSTLTTNDGTQTVTASAQVVRVVDGDTLVVLLTDNTQAKLRLVGINAPELNATNAKPPACQAKAAKDYLQQLVAGKSMTLEPDTTQANTDKYGRLLRFVSVEGVDVGLHMIAAGLAKEFQYSKLPHRRVTQYREAQQNAQTAAIGIWDRQICAQ